MRLTHPMHYVSVAAALVLLAGCASSSVNPGKPSTPERSAHSAAGYHGISYNACPAKGTLEYVSDQNDGTVNIFAGNFHGQAPCGILTGFLNPDGLMVRSGDLYVTKSPPSPQIRAFHRGGTSPFMIYADTTCGDEVAGDVTVSDDGYVIASNFLSMHCSTGSISVWKKSTGAFIANYPSASGRVLDFLTIQKDGTVYYDDTTPGLWVGKCVRGVCGSFSNTGAIFRSPDGIRSVDDEHVVLDDGNAIGGGRALTYTPPAFNSPSGSCTLGGMPVAIDINFKESHLFATYPNSGIAKEFKYPPGGGDGHACVLIGSVSTSGGFPFGIAVDRPESL